MSVGKTSEGIALRQTAVSTLKLKRRKHGEALSDYRINQPTEQ